MGNNISIKKENEIVIKGKKQSRRKEIWRRFKKNRMAMIGLIILILIILMAAFADLIAPYDYDDQNLNNAFQFPSFTHLMGTDNFGRDIFSRIVYGSRISLQVGLISVGISSLLGGSLGAIAAFYGGVIDNIVMRIMDVFQSIPGMLLAIAIAASLGTGINNMMIAIGIGATPGFCRIVRASVLTIKEMEFIEAARSIGANDIRIILKHVMPHAMAPIIVQATLNVASSILTASSLSFLGLGIQPPTPEWGSMLASSRQYLRDYWFMSIFPGIFIMLTVYSLNLLGDGLRDVLDPRLKN